MPEGDSLFRLAHRFNPVLAGAELKHTDFRVPQYAVADFSCWRISQVRSRGKYLLIELLPPSSQAATLTATAGVEAAVTQPRAEPATIISHLGMDGAWHLETTGTFRRIPEHKVRVVLTAQHLQPTLPTNPVRVFGTDLAKLIVTPDPESHLAHLGPDLLAPDWPERQTEYRAEILNRLRARNDEPIGSVLLDQRVAAGIGNIYRCDVLALAQLNPFQPVRSYDDAVLIATYQLARELLVANCPPVAVVSQRTTMGVRPDAVSPIGVRVASAAEFARQRHKLGYWVYRNVRHGCRRCGGSVRRDTLPATGLERDLYWCPTCQTH